MASSSSGSSFKQQSPAPSMSGSTTSTDMSSVTAAPPTIISSEKTPDDSSKLKTFLGILRKFIGVTDIATVRFSLPSQLIEPIPNLEYWHYLDRPETFVSIGDSDDSVERMLEVLRFWFTKDLKYVKGKPCKPYNSTLGEFFRCTWTVEDTLPPVRLSQDDKDNKDKKDKKDKKSEKEEKDKKNEKNEDAASKPKKQIKLSYLTEQTSHHPPVSAFYINCPEKGITARGFDQLSAKFTGTTIRVAPGAHNLGIFINLKNRDNEEYQLTHPAAHLSGILRGALHVSVADTCFVTCPKTKIKVILNYLDEGWIGKAQNRVVGVIYRYDPENDDKSKIKDVPEEDVLVRIDGCWKEQVYFTPAKSNDRQLMVDLKPLFPVPKAVPPQTEQLCNESQKFWNEVTEAILNKQFSQATKLKHNIEERQRQKAAERETNNEEWQPRFFTGTLTPMGKPDLSPEGIEALKGLHEGNYHLPESMKLGA